MEHAGHARREGSLHRPASARRRGEAGSSRPGSGRRRLGCPGRSYDHSRPGWQIPPLQPARGERPDRNRRRPARPLDRRAGDPADRPHDADRDAAPVSDRGREPRATQPRARSRRRRLVHRAGRGSGGPAGPGHRRRAADPPRPRQRAGRHRRRAGRQPLGDRTHRGRDRRHPAVGERPTRRLSAARRQSSLGDRPGRRRRPLVYRSRALGARPDHHRRHRLVGSPGSRHPSVRDRPRPARPALLHPIEAGCCWTDRPGGAAYAVRRGGGNGDRTRSTPAPAGKHD